MAIAFVNSATAGNGATSGTVTVSVPTGTVNMDFMVLTLTTTCQLKVTRA